jgi:hypothetical protein
MANEVPIDNIQFDKFKQEICAFLGIWTQASSVLGVDVRFQNYSLKWNENEMKFYCQIHKDVHQAGKQNIAELHTDIHTPKTKELC